MSPEAKEEWDREATNVLKKLGFPMVESLNTATSNLPRVCTCLTRRLAALDALVSTMEEGIAKQKQQRASNSTTDQKGSIQERTLGTNSEDDGCSCLPYMLHVDFCRVCQRVYMIIRMLAKVKLVYDKMENLVDQLGDLQTEGLIEGFAARLACVYTLRNPRACVACSTPTLNTHPNALKQTTRIGAKVMSAITEGRQLLLGFLSTNWNPRQ